MAWLVLCAVLNASAADPAREVEPTEPEGATASATTQFDIDTESALAAEEGADPLASAGVVTVAPTQRLLGNGQLTLNDYLVTIPGFDPRESFDHRWAGARGLTNSVNLMIDGVSLTSPIDYRNAAGDGLFLEEFEQVELTSGPAGVLWGAHSLLGVANLITGAAAKDETSFSVALGNRGRQRLTVGDSRSVGPGRLRLFVGYSARKQRSVAAPIRWAGVTPFTTGYALDTSTEPTSPRHDSYLTASARYETDSLIAYLRVPYARENNDVSRLGGVFTSGDGGRRQAVDALAYVALQRAFFEGALATLARVSWNLFDDYLDEGLLPASALSPTRIGSTRQVRMSRFGAVAEASHRLEGGRFRLSTFVGLDGSLELIHASNYATTSPAFDGLLVSEGPVVRGETALVGSGYVREELALWERVSVIGGVRYNLGGRAYQNTVLYQLAGGVRLLGSSYLKFGVTEGMRPPTLLDRAGTGSPVLGESNLRPERARAFQAEANGRWDGWGPLPSGFAGAAFARTLTSSNLVREGSGIVPFRLSPVSLNGFVINTLEAATELQLPWPDLRVAGMYYWKSVEENLPADSARQTEVMPNHGPEHRWYGRLECSPVAWLAFAGHVEGESGGIWSTTREVGVDLSGRLVAEQRPWGRYLLPGAMIRVVGGDGVWQVVLSAHNLLDQHPPVGQFAQPELGLGEAPTRSPAGRTFFVSFAWRGAGLEEP